MRWIALAGLMALTACAPVEGQPVPDGGLGGTGAIAPPDCPEDAVCEG